MQFIYCYVAPSLLKVGLLCHLDCVCILKSLYSVMISACRHKKFASLDLHIWVFGIRQDQPLEVLEGKIAVSNQEGASSPEVIGLL